MKRKLLILNALCTLILNIEGKNTTYEDSSTDYLISFEKPPVNFTCK